MSDMFNWYCGHKLEIKNTEDARLISEYGMIGGKIDGKTI